jgi:hypothetical protein
MSQTNNYYQISNEQLQLVNILERMYNDNIRQINSMTSSINNIRQTNTQIRNTLIQILNSITTARNSETTNNLNRVFIDNVPYIIDHVERYTIPINTNTRNTTNTNTRNTTNTNTRNTTNTNTRNATNTNTRNTTNTNTRNTTNTNRRRLRFFQNFFEPVEVYPTPSQIEAATRNVQYCDILNPINRTCPISLETFTDTDMVSVIRYCGHIFKREQLSTWFQTNCRCPVCRYDIRNYTSNSILLNQTDISNNSIDISNNFVEEEYEETNDNSNSTMNTITSYLDLLFDNGLNSLNDNLINEYTNVIENNDANILLNLLNSTIRRRR